MENLSRSPKVSDTDVLLTNLRVNKWDYLAYRETYGENALHRLKGITPDILELMSQNYDFTQDPKQQAIQQAYTC